MEVQYKCLDKMKSEIVEDPDNIIDRANHVIYSSQYFLAELICMKAQYFFDKQNDISYPEKQRNKMSANFYKEAFRILYGLSDTSRTGVADRCLQMRVALLFVMTSKEESISSLYDQSIEPDISMAVSKSDFLRVKSAQEAQVFRLYNEGVSLVLPERAGLFDQEKWSKFTSDMLVESGAVPDFLMGL